MRSHNGRVLALALAVVLAGCAQISDGTETAGTVDPSVTSAASPSPNETAASFPPQRSSNTSEAVTPYGLC